MVVRRPTSGSIVRGPVEGDVLGPGGLPWDPGVGGGAPFQYADVGTLIFHVEGNNVTESGGTVSAWPDQSGEGNDATFTGTAGQEPAYASSVAALNNKPAVLFTKANNDWLDLTGISYPSGDWTMLFVVNQLAVNTTQHFVDFNTGRLRTLTLSTAVVQYGDSTGTSGTQTTSAGAKLYTYRLTSGAGNAVIREDGADLETGLTYTQTAIGGSAALASRQDGGAVTLDGHMALALIYQGALSDTDLARVEAKAMADYGL